MDSVFIVDRHLLCEVEVSGDLVVQSLMRPFLIIEEEVVGQSPAEVGDRLVKVEVEILIFDRSPQSFDEDVVECSAASIHTDGNVLPFQLAGVPRGGELGALIGVKDLGLRDGEGLIEGIDTEIDLQCVGQSPQ